MEELYVGLLKEGVQKDMREAKSLMVFLYYCAERQEVVFSVTARGLYQLNGTNPYTITFVDEAEVTNMCKYGCYEWCHYFDDSKVSIFCSKNHV